MVHRKERMYVEPALAAARCPILRQLLGWTTSNAGLWRPTVADAPLLGWLRRNRIPPPHPAPGATQLTPRRALEWATAPLSRGGRTIRERAQEGVLEGDVGHATTSRPLLEFGEQEEVVWEFQSGREVRQGAAL